MKQSISVVAAGGRPVMHARDQIGEGPWYNANGQIIAANVADLHGDFQRDRNNMRKPMVGHFDRLGGANASWNAVHLTRSCSQEDLVATGGNGLFYCFAIG